MNSFFHIDRNTQWFRMVWGGHRISMTFFDAWNETLSHISPSKFVKVKYGPRQMTLVTANNMYNVHFTQYTWEKFVHLIVVVAVQQIPLLHGGSISKYLVGRKCLEYCGVHKEICFYCRSFFCTLFHHLLERSTCIVTMLLTLWRFFLSIFCHRGLLSTAARDPYFSKMEKKVDADDDDDYRLRFVASRFHFVPL